MSQVLKKVKEFIGSKRKGHIRKQNNKIASFFDQ